MLDLHFVEHLIGIDLTHNCDPLTSQAGTENA